jgi:hypothetical protein
MLSTALDLSAAEQLKKRERAPGYRLEPWDPYPVNQQLI